VNRRALQFGAQFVNCHGQRSHCVKEIKMRLSYFAKISY
jgi:hypothetical protein